MPIEHIISQGRSSNRMRQAGEEIRPSANNGKPKGEKFEGIQHLG